MTKKTYLVEGYFIKYFSRRVSAKTEAGAIRTARDRVIKNSKLKRSEFSKDDAAVWEIDK